MYASVNYPTKKAFREAVAAGAKVTLWSPGWLGPGPKADGREAVEGPHAPKPHAWYAQVTMKDGYVVAVK